MNLKILITALSLSCSFAYSQTNLKGTVKDEKGNPLIGATVVLNATQGTITNGDGSYTIAVLEDGKYIIKTHFTGLKPQNKTVSVEGEKEIIVDFVLLGSNLELNEVVITSNRMRETLDEVPSSVAVLSLKQIENLSQTSNSVADVLMEIPGMALSSNQTSSTGQTLRGRNMLVLIDGIPQSTPLRSGGRDVNTIDPSSLERVEVIKGATAIYGNGADGGIVNYITKKPSTAKRFESITSVGTEGSLVGIENSVGSKITQTISGKLDKLGYVASGSFRQIGVYKDANGEVISPTYGLGETTQYTLFGKVNYEITEKQQIELMYNYFSSNQNSKYTPQLGVYGESPTIGVLGEQVGVDQGNKYNHNAQLTYKYDEIFGKTDFRLNVYMQDFKTIYDYSDTFYDPNLGFDGGQTLITSSKRGARLNFSTPYSFGEIDGNVLYGIDILNDKTSQDLVDGRKWTPEMKMTNFAPYAQLKATYSDFILKAGIRFENINIDVPNYNTITRYNVGQTTPISGGIAINGGAIEYDATTFNAGLRFNKWQFLKPFVSFSQSFSIADLGRTLRSATENTVSNINSESVIANNYEVGFNSRIGQVNLSGAYFISTSELGSTYSETESGAFVILRQPEKVYGYEISMDTKLTKELTFGTSISYTEGKLDSKDSGDYDTYMGGDRIPPVKIVSFLSYDLDHKFNARLSMIYSGDRDRFEAPYSYGRGPVNDFTTVNLSTNYHITPSTKLSLGIRNLLNKDYYPLTSQWNARSANYVKANGTQFNVALTVSL